MSNVIISVKDLNKSFKLPHEVHRTLKSSLMNLHKRSFEVQHVLRDLNFEIEKGEFFGVVGRNGGGKSTLLKILAGIYQPTSGSIHVGAKLTPFIELGVGFNSELTGRENVFMSGVMLGMTRKQVEEVYDDIVEFAELKRFMDQKLKNYSSGMLVRLAFSVAIRAETDILLIDEVLAVGDASFQRKCYSYFEKLKKSDKTVVFISHDMDAINRFCDRAAIIKNGRIEMIDTPQVIAEEYFKENIKNVSTQKVKSTALEDDKSVKIVSSKVNGGEVATSVSGNEPIVLEVELKTTKDLKPGLVMGVVINQDLTTPIYWNNTKWEKVTIPEMKKGQKIIAKIEIENIFPDGQYSVDFALRNKDNSQTHIRQQAIAKFEVVRNQKNAHMFHANSKFEVNVK